MTRKLRQEYSQVGNASGVVLAIRAIPNFRVHISWRSDVENFCLCYCDHILAHETNGVKPFVGEN